MGQTWYQATGSKWAEFWTILHLPYTLMSLSFLAIGFGLGGVTRWDALLGIAAAYFLGLGLAAHSFDQLPGRGSIYVKQLTPRTLTIVGTSALVGGILLGIYWMLQLRAWHLIWMIPLQSFFTYSYPNGKFLNGFFHTDFWFSISFGFIPVMVGAYVNTLTIGLTFIPWALLAALLSAIEITLSRHSRQIRKQFQEQPSMKLLAMKPERALQLLCLASYLLALLALAGLLKYAGV